MKEPTLVDPNARRPRNRWFVVVRSFVGATLAALIVPKVVPPQATDLVVICVVWVVFYPVARLKQTEPWWAHWARGVIILIAFFVALRLFR